MEVEKGNEQTCFNSTYERGEKWRVLPWGLGAAEYMGNISQTAIGKRVYASPKLPCHLQLEDGSGKRNVNINDGRENARMWCDACRQPLCIPVHLWSCRGPPTLCGTQSGQRLGRKTDQPHTLQPFWEKRVKSFITNAKYEWEISKYNP